MTKRTFVLGFLLFFLVSNIYPAPKYQNLHALWISQQGQKGIFTFEDGGIVFTISPIGSSRVLVVGDDYVEFGAVIPTIAAQHRVIPFDRLELRGPFGGGA